MTHEIDNRIANDVASDVANPISSLLEGAFDAETFRANGHRLVDLVADYLADNRTGNPPQSPALPWKAPADMEAKWKKRFYSPTGTIAEADFDLEDFCREVIADSTHMHHPHYIGHQVVPPAPLSALMEMVSAFLNNSMAIYELGPFSSAAEKIVTDWLAGALGMTEKAAGVLTSGGSIGNLTGLLAARQQVAGYDAWHEGSAGHRPLAAMVSSESHYSMARAVKIMGWGEQGIVKIPVNDRREIDARRLEETYCRAIEEGKQVVALVANACTTSTGSYDPLDEIAAFCREKGIWMHVDAAHGGGAVLCDRYRHLVKGIEKADSVVVDFHKMLLCPALTTAVIFRDGQRSYETFSQKASYLLNPEKADQWYDIAQRTLECTKKMMGLKIYALLKMYGPRLFEDYITRTYDLARGFSALLGRSGDFQLALEPAANIVCFRYKPAEKSEGELNRLNSFVRERLKEDGEYYIVQTEIDGAVYLRTALMNAFTGIDSLERLLQKIRETAFTGEV